MKSDEDRDKRIFTPGTIVPVSGIYHVIHLQHREPHEVIAIRGEEFPACRLCKADVRFQVIRVLPHMTHDFDLTGPAPRSMKRRARAAGSEAK